MCDQSIVCAFIRNFEASNEFIFKLSFGSGISTGWLISARHSLSANLKTAANPQFPLSTPAERLSEKYDKNVHWIDRHD